MRVSPPAAHNAEVTQEKMKENQISAFSTYIISTKEACIFFREEKKKLKENRRPTDGGDGGKKEVNEIEGLQKKRDR